MRRTSFGGWPCSIARTVDVLGDAWTVLVLRELSYGESKFESFVSSLGIPRNTLTDRLKSLVDKGLVDRRTYQSDPVRHEYVLTEKGRDFFGVLAALNAWGDRWLADEAGVPIVIRHDECEHDLTAAVVCSACGETVRLEDVSVRPGPGYPRKLAESPTVITRLGRSLPVD